MSTAFRNTAYNLVRAAFELTNHVRANRLESKGHGLRQVILVRPEGGKIIAVYTLGGLRPRGLPITYLGWPVKVMPYSVAESRAGTTSWTKATKDTKRGSLLHGARKKVKSKRTRPTSPVTIPSPDTDMVVDPMDTDVVMPPMDTLPPMEAPVPLDAGAAPQYVPEFAGGGADVQMEMPIPADVMLPGDSFVPLEQQVALNNPEIPVEQARNELVAYYQSKSRTGFRRAEVTQVTTENNQIVFYTRGGRWPIGLPRWYKGYRVIVKDDSAYVMGWVVR